MPAIFTHLQFGKDVVASLPPSFSDLAAKHPQCFYVGTQGPDLLFYYKPLSGKKNATRNKAWYFHDDLPSGELFLRAAKALVDDKENYDEHGNFLPQSKDAAYLLGFLCHFCLDYTTHPYIDNQSVDGRTHGKIESELDKRTFRKQGMPARGFNTAKLFFPICESKLASASFLSLSEKVTEKALKNMRFINGLFSSNCEFVHGVCHTLLSLVGANKTLGEMFIHKKDDERCAPLWETLDTLYNKALSTANTVITEFFSCMESSAKNNILTNDIFRYNYSGIIPKENNS
jgi:hypothetical protein